MVINELDCSIEDLAFEDFAHESRETATFVMEQVMLNRAASELFFHYCSPKQLPLYTCEDARHRALQEVQTKLQMWHISLPRQGQRQRRHYLSLTLELYY